MIYIVGEITEEKYEAFDKAMRDSEASKAKILDIVINSGGGCMYTAMAIHDRIINSHKEVRVTVYGSCMSAAVIILAAGDIRRMSSNSWAMVHEDEPFVEEGAKVHNMEAVAKHGRRVEEQWDELLERATGTPASTWKVLHKVETYLTAEECKQYGLIQEIL